MLLKITTTYQPATDLGYLLGKHPGRFQTKELNFGKAHVFFPEANEKRCTAALLLDLNSINLAKAHQRKVRGHVALAHYVNDRPYAASSFLTTAMTKVFSSALNGSCRDRPELVSTKLPLVAEITAVPSRGGEAMIRRFFEPLGYEISLQNQLLDEQFPTWGDSPYFKITLTHMITLQELLTHLFVLIPVLDNNKHYYVDKTEIEKLLEKGGDWLKNHPAQEQITRRYLKHQNSYAKEALARLVDETDLKTTTESKNLEVEIEEKLSVHEMRLQTVLEKLKATGAKSVVDLGCGSGKLLRLLLKEKQFEKIVGMDVAYKSLEVAKRRLHLDEMSSKMAERIQLIHGSLIYKDDRVANFDAAALVEVIEHLDEMRLAALEKVVFAFARPKTLVITTPNAEYNALFENMHPGQFRHNDHRFEWTRAQFQEWGNRVAAEYDYEVAYFPIGEEHPEFGGISQMGIFTLKTNL